VVTAVPAERDVLGEAFEAAGVVLRTSTIGPYPAVVGDRLTLLAGGVGPAAAAAATARALTHVPADLVLSAGIGGGFAGRANVGDVALASEIVAADLGAESPDGFLSLDELGFGQSVVPAVDLGLSGARRGRVLTVSTVTGTDSRAHDLLARHGAVAEAMEGFGVAEAARAAGVPVAELRGISNTVGRRDRDSWDLPAAFAALRRAVPRLVELLERTERCPSRPPA
jgi:futalosine hydrolase